MKQKIQLTMNVPNKGYSLRIENVYHHKNQLVAVAMMRYQRDQAEFGLTTISSDEVTVDLEEFNAALSVRFQVVMFHPHQVAWAEWQPADLRHQLDCVASLNPEDDFVKEGHLLYTSMFARPTYPSLSYLERVELRQGFFRICDRPGGIKLICDRPSLNSTHSSQ